MLRKVLFVLVASTIFISCKEENNGFTINGKIDSFYSGREIKITKISEKGPKTIDSTIITNGKLTLKGAVESPDMYYIIIDDVKGGIPIILENTEMNIDFYKDSLQYSLVTGSKENDVFKIFKDAAKPLRKINEQLGEEYKVAQSNGDFEAMRNIRKTYDSLADINYKESLEIIKQQNDAVTSAIFLEDFMKGKIVELKEVKALYDNFTSEVKSSTAGKDLNTFIQASIVTAEGSIAPDFSGPNPEGKIIALNDIKGKATIIDFWAAWCGPCRKENPNVVKVYNKYHDKGLEIIGISLDGTPRQKDAKAAWIEAIEKDSLTWHHISNLQYFNGPIAKQYNIQAIPATFILDEEGKIVAKNLRGQALEDKIAEMLN